MSNNQANSSDPSEQIGRKINGPIIALYRTCTYFDLENVESNPVFIHDIAHALSNICRFNGHVRDFFSVAQHCVIGMEEMQKHCNQNYHSHYAFLLHDAAEAYMGDMSSPLKRLFPNYKELYKRVEAHVSKALNVTYPFKHIVHEFDMRMLQTERQQLLGNYENWTALEQYLPFDIKLEPWGPSYARYRFLKAFYDLREKLGYKELPEKWVAG